LVPEPGNEAVLGIIGGAGVGAAVRLYIDVAARVRAATGSLPSSALWNLPLSDEIERSFIGGDADGDGAMAAERLVAESVERLLAAGATVIAMPCNSLQSSAARESRRRGVPFIDMIAATLDAVRASGRGSAVLLATEATYAAGFYEDHDVEIIAPPPGLRDELAELIMRGSRDGSARASCVPSCSTPTARRRASCSAAPTSAACSTARLRSTRMSSSRRPASPTDVPTRWESPRRPGEREER
jgi:aspartate racemase